ncbi:MAG: AAA family ATPase [Bacilli bacterium]|nr:AAA family ATPase [Bacilli bacterium]
MNILGSAEFFTSNSAIAVYIVIIALLVVVIAVATIIDIKKKHDFRKQNNLENVEKEKSGKNTRFPELTEFDHAHKDFENEPSEPNLTLASFCEKFRNYSAKDLGLYYSIDNIREFIANLSVSKIMILQGMSGTGKTSIAVAFGKFINNSSTVVPVQPMWKERSDLLGYYNEFTGKFNETAILEKLYEASFSDRMFIVVLDEMNIARVEYYFSEFLSLLELPATSERDLVVAAAGAKGDPKKMSHGKIILPDNVWFLGTANNDDSTFAISDKVYDRAMIMNLNSRAESFEVNEETSSIHISTKTFEELVNKARSEITLSEEGARQIHELDTFLVNKFHVTFGNRIMMQIGKYVPAYVACGGKEVKALDDIISKKILRKLESQNPVYVRSASEELIAKFDEIFGQDVMVNCIDYVRQIANNG